MMASDAFKNRRTLLVKAVQVKALGGYSEEGDVRQILIESRSSSERARQFEHCAG
jgi:hypothetical protein